MSAPVHEDESPEFAALREAGRELGASFLPITKDQGVVLRATLHAANGTFQERRTVVRS